MSKGSRRRPTNEAAFASGWDRIFKCGVPEQSNGGGSNPPSPKRAAVGAIPTSAAIYVDDSTGKLVPEEFWPGD